MKLHGKTIIELKDTRSGRIDRFEDGNAVMDANMEAKFRNFGIFQTNIQNNFASTALWQKLMGGMLLLGDTVADNSNFVAPGTKMVGRGYYGSSNNGSPVSLGSWNATESVLGANSIQMVYDYTTSQANGEIKSVCLTSDLVGRCGIGNTAGDYNLSLKVNPGTWQTANKTFSDNRWNGNFAFDGVYLYYGVTVDGTALTIKRKLANALKVDLIHTLTDENTVSDIAVTLPSAMTYTDNLRMTQVSATKIVVIGYQATSSKAFSAAIIDISGTPSATVVEITGMPEITDVAYGYTNPIGVGVDGNGNPLIAFSAYCWNLASVLVNLGTGAKISFVDANTYASYTGQNYRSSSYLQPIGNGMYIMGASVNVPGMVCDYSDSSAEYCEASLPAYNPMICGVDLLNYEGGGIKLVQNPFFLSTINNLSSAVTKTSSQTMKVTYVITRA